ncbi:carcinoembryonic antigen-related cell adhesion molecule 5-like, partial [Clarias magur]
KPKATVTVNPVSSIYTGDRVTLSCDLQSTGWTFLFYEDQKSSPLSDGAPVANTLEVTVSNEGEINYYCKARRGNYESEFSDAATITVREKPKPDLTSNRRGETLTGNSVTLTCTLNLQSAGWKFYWNKDRQSTETETETYTHYYTITPVSVSDGGQYRCRAGRGKPVYYTQYSDARRVNVIEIKPVVIINPDTQVFRGERVTFRCNMMRGRNTEWTYSWYENDNTPLHHTTQTFTWDITGQYWSYYGGKYTCRGTRISDSQVSEMSAAVTLSVSAKPRPTVIVDPQSSIYTGDRVTLSCDLPSTGWTFLWYKDQKSRYLKPGNPHNNTLSVTVSNEGQITYYCKAHRGNYESDFSDPATITVREKPKPDLRSDREGETLTGNSVTLTCTLNLQSAGWKFYWNKDTQSTETETETDTDTHSYTITPVSVSDGAKPKATVRVNPVSSIYTGDRLTLSCDLQSTGWTFLWYKDQKSSPLSDGAPVANTLEVTVSNEGEIKYYCKARRGNYESEFSDAATITVR